MKTYDLVIIGSGTAAQAASSRVRAAGWSVALVDHRPFGGTCALRGCDPKRVLISGAEAIDAETRMRGHGVTGEARIDWRDLMMFKRSFTDAVPRNLERDFAENGIDAFHGVARFTGRDAIVAEGREFKARYTLIAAGARPIPLDIPGQEHAVTSDVFLELDRLPARIVLVGGGYIAAEFSHLAARAGVHVTVLQRAEQMLPAFDPDLVGWLMEKFGELGIDVRTRTTVQRIDKTGGGFIVRASTDGQEQEVAADLVVHAAGREPDLTALDLAAGGVATENGRVKLNELLQSASNPKVYAEVTPQATARRSRRYRATMARSLRKTFSTATGTGRTTGAFRASHSQSRQLLRLASARRRRARRGSNSECTRRRLLTGTQPDDSTNQSMASRHWWRKTPIAYWALTSSGPMPKRSSTYSALRSVTGSRRKI
jgi:pyruvate/2-oxoglutarate dehydrogenase complex dihydrolipoamide dehydrogenase (E3) component